MIDNGDLHTMEITDNGERNTIENYRQWKMTDNGEYQRMWNDRPGGIVDNAELFSRGMINNGGWKTTGHFRSTPSIPCGWGFC